MSEAVELPGRCGMTSMLQRLGRAWTADLILLLGKNPAMRFGSIRRRLAGKISARVLAVRLKELETMGLVSRVDAGTVPLHVEYSLTAAGRRLDAVLSQGEAALTEFGLLDLFEPPADGRSL